MRRASHERRDGFASGLVRRALVQPGHLSRMRRQQPGPRTILEHLELGGEQIERVGIDDHRLFCSPNEFQNLVAAFFPETRPYGEDITFYLEDIQIRVDWPDHPFR